MSEKANIACEPHRIGSTAVQEMAKMDIPPMPPLYQVWFAYLEKKNYDLALEIEQRVNSQKPVDEYFLKDMHEKYFQVTQSAKKIEHFAVDMVQETSSLQNLAATFGLSAKDFRDDLSGISQKIDASTDRDPETEEVLSSLVRTAHKAIEQNSKLEENITRALAQITSLQESIGKVVSDANTDPLTKLNNRRYFDTIAPKLLAATRAEKKPLCYVVADIDHFRQFNDKWGHQIGDQVLKLVGHVLRENVKSQDLYARYGGNEFVLALPNKTLADAAALADNIRISIGKRKLVNKTTNDNLGRMTVSFGVVESQNSESSDELIRAADAAMSKAKEQGRDCVVS
jgi:diguanylate cyclase